MEIGAHVGPYRVVGKLGEGGMGEVYRAHDTRLQRDVAIKVLSKALADTPEARARFEREALSVAKLSHPNILAIYEFGEHDGSTFVVTELVDGETLRTRLEAGPLSQRRAVGYALQIARGIAAAHARGIVHRDLKPENVMITRDDQVKILDFGLAKTIEPSQTDETRVGVATTAGTVLGTFAYMAPEQVRGLAIDHRADMFAFGAVLYEMLSGERAFKGETAADTMTAILTKEPPDLDTVRLAMSPSLERIVRRCLEKIPDLRFQSANDLAFALETLSTVSTSSAAPVDTTLPLPVRAGAGRAAWLPWAVAFAALATAAAVWTYKPAAPLAEPPWQRFTHVTEAAGVETSPTLSPDGSTVAYAIRMNGSWDIYAQRVGGRNGTPIVNDPKRNEGGPAYSPDGSLIAFHESDDDGGIFIAGATGESVRRVTDVGFDPAWSPDGKQIAFSTEEVRDPASRQTISTLYVVNVAGGTPRRLVEGDAIQPAWSPSGERIVYWSNNGGQRDLFTVAAAGGSRVPLTEDAALDWSPVWSSDGFVYFSSDRGGAMNLWRIAVDQTSGRAHGVATPVTTGVQASASLSRLSRDGTRLAFRSRVASVNPVAIPFDPATNRAGVPMVLDGSNNIRVPSDVSPDGTQIAYFSVGESDEDIFIGSVDGKGMRRLTDDPSRDRGPVFTRDGQSIVFYSNRDGGWAIWSIRTDGSNLRKIAGVQPGSVYPVMSSLDDTIVFSSTQSKGGIHTVPFSASRQPTILPGTAIASGYLLATSWSRDGARLCGPLVSESGRSSGVAVYDLQAHTTTTIASDEAFGARWLPDNRRVMYFSGGSHRELVIVDTVTRQRSVVPVRLPGDSTNDVFALSPDGRTIYYGAVHEEADIWIAERK